MSYTPDDNFRFEDVLMLRPAWDPGKFDLTDLEGIRRLLEENRTMKGIIRAKGVCPTCGEKFVEIPGVAFTCLEHKTVPKRCYVDLHWKGERIRIFCNKAGEPLETYKQAETVAKNVEYEIEHYTFDPQMYIKAELTKFWTASLLGKFDEHKLKTSAPGYKHYFSHMVGLAKTYFGTKDVREIRKLDLINYREHLEKEHKEWKPKTLKNVLDVFKTFMLYVKNDLELIDKVLSFPVVDVPDAPYRWLEQKDQTTLFEKVPDEHKPIIGFLMLHGCRPGEARALKCKNVDLEHGAITICATFSGEEYCERRKGKGSRILVIPIHPEAFDYLEARVRRALPEAFVFINPRTGNPYTEHQILDVWDQVRTAAGVSKDLRLYDASRHSFASQLVNSGVSLFTVSKLLGHSSTKMTEKYSHANLESMRTPLSKVSLKKDHTVTKLSPRTKEKKKT